MAVGSRSLLHLEDAVLTAGTIPGNPWRTILLSNASNRYRPAMTSQAGRGGGWLGLRRRVAITVRIASLRRRRTIRRKTRPDFSLPPLRGRVASGSSAAGRSPAERGRRFRIGRSRREGRPLEQRRAATLPPGSAGHPPPQWGEGESRAIPFPGQNCRWRGEGTGDLVVDGIRRQPTVRGRCRKSLIRRYPLTPALRAPFTPDAGGWDRSDPQGLSPPAGRGGKRDIFGNAALVGD